MGNDEIIQYLKETVETLEKIASKFPLKSEENANLYRAWGSAKHALNYFQLLESHIPTPTKGDKK